MSNQETVWARAKRLLKGRLDDWQYASWIEPLVLLAEGEGALALEAPNSFFLDWLTNNYLAEIRAAVLEAGGGEREIVLSAAKVAVDAPPATPSPAPAPKASVKAGARHRVLEPDYTFENFVVGKSNAFAHAAALQVAEKPGRGYNPFFLYGGSGLGKTHLMQAIGHAIHAKDPAKSILYVRCEDYLNEVVGGIRHKTMDEFRKRYRKLDVWMIDDIQFIGGKESTMEETFNTFNALLDAKKQIILTSDRSPKEIQELDKRLLSRFVMGLVADIQPPELETRLAILRQQAESEGFALPDDVITFLAANFSSDVRELKGAANRLRVFSSLVGAPLSVDLAKENLRDLLDQRHRTLSPEGIIKDAARELGVKVADLRSKRRSRDIAVPRQIIMYLLRRHTDLSLPAIGELFGGRDHTTVLHGVGKVEERMAADAEFKGRVDTLMRGFARG